MGEPGLKSAPQGLKGALQRLKLMLYGQRDEAPSAKPKGAAQVSPLAPKQGFPPLPAIKGVSYASAAGGVKYKGRKDIALIRLAPGSAIAGVFTTSFTRSAAVSDCQTKLALRRAGAGLPKKDDAGAAFIINSGNANAFTGKAGVRAVEAISGAAAQALGIAPTRIFTASTGVIGEPLPHRKITDALPGLVASLRSDGIEEIARAIMTTDTFPKGAAASIQGEGGPIQIAGIAKGSGMIAPDMATMLAYIFTDAKVSPAALQKMLARGVQGTFGSITVDSDTSTSDTLLVAATGQSTAAPLKGAAAKAFEEALHGVMHDLALQIVRDGEGARKLVEIAVTRAASDEDAAKVAFAIANSPLVKTAIAGQDPNWGRIIAAIGKSGARAERDLLTIHFGDLLVASAGKRSPRYSEAEGAAYFQRDSLLIRVDLAMGRAKRRVWTCDLTARYIEINADYRS